MYYHASDASTGPSDVLERAMTTDHLQRPPSAIRLAAACVFILGVVGCTSSDNTSEATPTSDAPRTTAAATSASVGCDAAPTSPSGPQAIHVDGVSRRYLISVPNEPVSNPRPLVLDLHGFTATAENQDALTNMAAVGTTRGYIVASPEALPAQVGGANGPLWNLVAAYAGPQVDVGVETSIPEGDDVTYINAVVEHIEDTQCVDTDREYITGMSAGAGMTTWVACQPHNRFAASAPVAGSTQTKSCPADTVPPTLLIHGDADPLVPYTGGDLVGFPLDIPAVEDRAADFAARQGCDPTPMSAPIGDDVIHTIWTCPEGAAMELYKVIGGGHTWPGTSIDPNASQTIDSTTLILDFFDQHQRTAGR
jgi:polyhydroxybutyrate depolymerase